ncbi:L,D-transpeptidase family protein [Flavobacterium sp.]
MKYLIILISVFILSSCKTETKKQPAPKAVVAKREKPFEGKIIQIDTTLYNSFKSPALKIFYTNFNNETVWQITALRQFVLSEFKNAETEGLFAKDYNYVKLMDIEKKISSLSDDELVDYDLLLTFSFQKYIKHISQGKIDPKTIYDDWDLKTKKTDVSKILIKAFKEQDHFAMVIDSCKPKHEVYKKLKRALSILNSFPEDTLKSIATLDKIVPNDSLKAIISIKKRLIYWNDLNISDSLTAIYDSKTVEAIKKFQFRHGLASDGVIGKGTINALNFTKTKRKHQIMVNMERWKWYPNEFAEEYLMINIPDYSLVVVKNKDTIRTHKIIVGTIKRKTPILTSKLSYAVFNPTWTVPPTILKEDVIPAMLKNKNYLAKKNITAYDTNGNIVSADNWSASKAKSYRYVQSPGSYNSLGMVKIIFPNKFSVYLHDTNHRDYFGKTNRSLSSGCVRVENPLELTNYLLKDSIKYPMDSITSILKKMETKTAPIKSNVYLYQWYWTAWSSNNKLIFRDDIYNLDDDLYKKLQE